MNPEKGKKFGGECNRKVCVSTATYYNNSTLAYYCEGCAIAINKFAPGLCVLKTPTKTTVE